MSRAVFLDKDGTIVRDVPYNVAPGKVELLPGAVEGLTLLQDAGYKLIVVSNQSGLARGCFTLGQLWEGLSAVTRRLRESDVVLDGFYFCPHHPEGTVQPYAVECSCRKPHPGMLLTAAGEHNVDLSASWMVGDILDDVEAGRAAGCHTVLIDNGGETRWERNPRREPDLIVAGLEEAARAILAAPLGAKAVTEAREGKTPVRTAERRTA